MTQPIDPSKSSAGINKARLKKPEPVLPKLPVEKAEHGCCMPGDRTSLSPNAQPARPSKLDLCNAVKEAKKAEVKESGCCKKPVIYKIRMDDPQVGPIKRCPIDRPKIFKIMADDRQPGPIGRPGKPDIIKVMSDDRQPGPIGRPDKPDIIKVMSDDRQPGPIGRPDKPEIYKIKADDLQPGPLERPSKPEIIKVMSDDRQPGPRGKFL